MSVATALNKLERLFAEYMVIARATSGSEARSRMRTWHQDLGECFTGLVKMANDGHSDFAPIEAALARFGEIAAARFGSAFSGPKIPFGVLPSLYLLRADLRFAVANHGSCADCVCSVLIDNDLVARGPETVSLDVVGRCDEQFDCYIEYKCKGCQRGWRLHDTSGIHGHSGQWELL